MLIVRRLVLVSLIALAFPPSAAAGGWWSLIETDRSRVAVGQRVTAEADVLVSVRAAREVESRGFYAYALRGFDYSIVTRAMNERSPRSWWSLGDARAVELGPVVVRVSGRFLGRARATFTVPKVAPATYTLMFCDAGCAHPLEEVVPTKGFTVVADPATVKLAERTTRLTRQSARQARSLADAREADRRAEAALADTESELGALEQQVRRLERRIADAADPASPPLWASAGWLLAGVLTGALASLALRRRWGPGPSVPRGSSR